MSVDRLHATPPSYELTRFALLRLLGLVYVAAFYSLATQVVPLVGENGLTPAAQLLRRVAESSSRAQGFWAMPSLFWWRCSDGLLLGLAWLGFAASLVVLGGYANALLLALLWALYLSFVHVGQLWYGFGWELLLCEAGFLAIFLCPLLDGRPLPGRPAPVAVLWLYRWLALRVMLGAGLIKLRGDSCWRELTCLDFHFETQPLPNPLSPLFHFLPGWAHKLGVIFNHVSELALPFGVFGPRRVRHVAGLLMLAFQATLILSGNLSFLNWLSMVPLLACLDDSLLGRLLPRRLAAAAQASAERAVPSPVGRFATIVLVGLIALLSISPTVNLFSARQTMNGSFDPFYLVNTYGAFGSVGQTRDELVFEGTHAEAHAGDGTRAAVPDASAEWLAYEFKCKPGDVRRRPCLLSPVQYRLDWQLWFAAMSEPQAEPWTVHLVYKLLRGDRGTLSLLGHNPFPDGPPRFVRVERYRYRFAPLGAGEWWRRERVGVFLPPLSADDAGLQEVLREFGWLRQP